MTGSFDWTALAATVAVLVLALIVLRWVWRSTRFILKAILLAVLLFVAAALIFNAAAVLTNPGIVGPPE